MNGLLLVPLEVRLGVLVLGGMVLGGQLNRAIYRLAWNPREIDPWGSAPPGAAPRTWRDRVPVLGWWGLRRETPFHGRWFWVRPMLLEIGTGLGLAALYWLEVARAIPWPVLPAAIAPPPSTLHATFLAHAVLTCLMIVATFIDFDEQTIPDEITVSGSVLALLLAALLPAAALPTVLDALDAPPQVYSLVLTSANTADAWLDSRGGPHTWPARLNGPVGLALGLIGIWAWAVAILHKTWTTRQGWLRAIRYMIASVVRHRTWPVPLGVAAGLTVLVLVVWSIGAARWESVLSAVVGLCFGGGLIWIVRILGHRALGVEAMGFGDVTLMAMIGAFLGWQATFLVFFLAPFTAVLIAAAQRLFTGRREIAFGPFLCLAALIVILGWDALWHSWALPLFTFGWFIPAMLVCCLALMGVLLWLWRLFRDALFG